MSVPAGTPPRRSAAATTATTLAVLALVGCAVLGFLAFRAFGDLEQVRRDQAETAAELSTLRAQADAERETSSQQLAALKAELSGQLAALGSKLTVQEKQLAAVVDSAPPDWREVARRVAQSVVLVKCRESTGSGFAVTMPGLPAGYRSAILTNAHVVQGCKVGSLNEVSYVKDGTNTGALLADAAYQPDDNRDIALIYTRETIAALSPGPAPQQGDEVATMGFPLGLPSNFTTGVVSHVYADGWIQTNAPISAGNSGGPLLDDKGRVLGLTTWSIVYTPEAEPRPTQNLNFAEPLSNACGFVTGSCPFAAG